MKEEEIMQNKKTANTAEDVVKKKTAAQVQGKEKDSNGSTASGKSIKNLSSIPDFDMILGQGVHYSRDDYRTKLNNNVCVVGTSGAGKTRSIVKPNLMQASGSYVVSDPKGNLANENILAERSEARMSFVKRLIMRSAESKGIKLSEEELEAEVGQRKKVSEDEYKYFYERR